jgi:repressor LexA
MNRRPITQRQIVALEVIKNYTQKKGYPPSVRDICEQMGNISPNAVQKYLVGLEQIGKIRRSPKIARSIVVVS